jgi:hypothetical protein
MDLNAAQLAASAAIKMANGSLMTIDEVGARLSISPMTVHRMPLPSIRLGRSLRFDPRDVTRLIAGSREETTPRHTDHAYLGTVGAQAIGPNGAGTGHAQGSDEVSALDVAEAPPGRGMPPQILTGSQSEDRLRSTPQTLTENNP